MFAGINLLNKEESYETDSNSSDSSSSSCKKPLSTVCSTIGLIGNDEEYDDEEESPFLTAIPYIVSFLVAIIVLWGGAYVMQQIDDTLHHKPLYMVMLYTLQVVCTIGWGDMVSSNSASQIFAVILTLFGTPLVYVAFSNIGRLFDRNYSPNWQFLTNVIRKKTHASVKMPIIKALNFLVLHTFIVCIINTEWIQNIGTINSMYFIISSEATVGMGDYLPSPRNFFESIVCQVYIIFGIILITYWFTCFAYYYQRFHFVAIRKFLFYLYKKFYEMRQENSDEKLCYRF